ncbi:deuterolysin M35 metalloprotease [Auricularia subglabra TFB-10046 SS5]|nr:deuterolysin M35 metalloprotease [Auricularia subglabra TFB-10046 SS5]
MLSVQLVAMLLFSTGLTVSARTALSVSLSGAARFDGVANAVVSATVTNTGDESVKVLNAPGSVLSKGPTDVFVISSSDGKAPRFQGLFTKYVPKIGKSYTTIAPGQSITVDHSLADAYDFSQSGAGNYHISVASDFYVLTADGVEKLVAAVAPHTARLSGTLVKRSPAPLPLKITGCTKENTTVIENVLNNANVLVRDATKELASHSFETATPRYQTWFGAPTFKRYSQVSSVFGGLNETSFADYTYECVDAARCAGVDDGDAFTRPDAINHFFICPAFFAVKPNPDGSETQPGILVHLATHWDTTGSTGHQATGVDSSRLLAKSNPELAVTNADSFEYFAENVK